MERVLGGFFAKCIDSLITSLCMCIRRYTGSRNHHEGSIAIAGCN